LLSPCFTYLFLGYDWCLIDSVYIQNVTNNADKQRWHKFFSRLGVTDFITVRHVQVELDSESVVCILDDILMVQYTVKPVLKGHL